MIDLSKKYFDRLSNDALKKLQKSMYRAVDLIEAFFPDPRDVNKKITLGPYQKDFIDTIQFGFPLSQFRFAEVKETPEGVIFITRRQVGKSVSCGYTSAALMILGPWKAGKPPCWNGMVAASEEESFLLLDKTKYALENSDFNDFIVGKPKLDKIKLANGSYTKAHTCSHKSIRGPAYHYIFIDEGAQMDENILFTAALPTVEHGERWIVITTPQGSKGQIIDYYMQGVASRHIICENCGREYLQSSFANVDFPIKNQIWKMPALPECESCGHPKYKYSVGVWATPYLDPWRSPIIDQVKLKKRMETFGWSPWARQEWLGEIIDEASMVILREWIDKNTVKTLRNKMELIPNADYILGMDYGRLHDASSFCITHRDRQSQKIVLDYMRTISGQYDFDTDYDAIHKQFKEIAMFYRPTMLVVDSTGLGYSQVERVKKDLQYEWSLPTKILCNTNDRLGFIFSKKSKPDLIANLITMLSKNPPQLEIPPTTEPEINELVTEMLRFECEVMEAGYIKYGTQNYHDDRVISFALSLWGHKQSKWFYSKPRGFDYEVIPKKDRSLSKNKVYRQQRRIRSRLGDDVF